MKLVSFLFKLARLLNDIQHITRGTYHLRIINKVAKKIECNFTICNGKVSYRAFKMVLEGVNG